MCRSQAEGGQRCASHAREAMQKAAERYRSVQAEFEKAKASGHQAKANELDYEAIDRYGDYDDACINYASTPQGEADFRARMEAAGQQPAVIEAYRGHIEKGLLRRERNEAIRVAVAAGRPASSAVPAPTLRVNEFHGILRSSSSRDGCGCACASGGFCGGCGHAGCGGR